MPFGIRLGSLRTKIIAWSFIPTMIILVIVAMVIFDAYQDVTEELVIQRNHEVTRLMAGQHEAALNEYADLLEAETRMPNIYEGDPVAQRDALKGAGNRLVAFDGGTLILDTFGKVVAAEPERPEILQNDWSEHTYYREVLRLQMRGASEPVFSDIVADGPNGSEVLCVAVPINGEAGEFVGIMVGVFRMGATSISTFYGDIQKLYGEEVSSTHIIVDGSGRVIYHSDTDQIGDDFSAQDVVRRVLNGHEETILTKDRDGLSIVASYAPVPGTSWGLLIEESWDSVISSSQGYRNLLLGLLALGVLLPTLIVGVGVRRITRPIKELTRGAQRIAGGDFDYRIASRTGDELGDLAQQFNAMAGALRESYSNLEQKIEERTLAERRRADQLRTINEVGRSISSILSLDELLPFVASSIQETFGYYNVNILLVDQASGDLHLRASAGDYQGATPIGIEVKAAGRGIIGWVAQSGESRVVNDVSMDPTYYAIEELADTRAELVVPIRAGGEILGVLDIESDEINTFDEMDVFTAETLADQLAVAIRNTQLYEQAGELATVHERQRLARDLHDAVTQTLFSASIIADVLPRLWEKSPADGQQRLEELRQLTRGALAEMRMLLLELRPAALTEAALGDLLRQLTQAVTAKSRLPITLTVDGQCPMPPDVQVALYRIAQEAMNNMVKHARASQAGIHLNCQPSLVELIVSDDGSGFDPNNVAPDHLGLGIMRERAEAVGARLEIDSQVGHGTKITVVWTETGEKE